MIRAQYVAVEPVVNTPEPVVNTAIEVSAKFATTKRVDTRTPESRRAYFRDYRRKARAK